MRLRTDPLVPSDVGGGGSERRPVLVVDDDPNIRALVTEVVADGGYPVIGVADGADALAALERNSACLILLDMEMPVMDGRAFVRRHRASGAPSVPIVVMTAARDAAARAREVDADGVLPKPFDLDDLEALLRRYCD